MIDTDEHPDDKTSRTVPTAPEVPHAIAKQYDIHTEAIQASAPRKVIVEDTTEKSSEDVDDSLEDPETDAVVEELVRQEGDQLLAAQQDAPRSAPKLISKKQHWIKRFFKGWWRNGFLRWMTILLLLGSIAAVCIVPTARYKMLNAVGVHSAASVFVVDETTKLPLKNVKVTIGNKTAYTDVKGMASVNDLRLGRSHLEVMRVAFASYERDVTIGWGSNPLGTVAIRAVGTQYSIQVQDYLTGGPLAGVEATSERANALSDGKGIISLTVSDSDIAKLSVTITAQGYRAQVVAVDAMAAAPTVVALTPSQKTVYISKISGKYDVYSSDIDGQDAKILLAGTGHETSTISLVVNPDNTQAALVSTRDNKRDGDGNLLQGLTVINLATGTSTAVDSAAQIQLVDWVGDRLIYRSTIAGAGSNDAQRNRLVTYVYATNARTQLASVNQFNAIISAKGYLYYAVASTDPSAMPGLFRIKPDGSGRERLSDKEIWAVLRTTNDTLSVQEPDGWSTLDLDTKDMQQAAAPSLLVSYYFANSPNGSQVAWAETRAGTGVLTLKDTKGEDAVLVSQSGITHPVRWLDETTIIYRIATPTETADYVVSVKGGIARKVSNVAASYGFAQAN